MWIPPESFDFTTYTHCIVSVLSEPSGLALHSSLSSSLRLSVCLSLSLLPLLPLAFPNITVLARQSVIFPCCDPGPNTHTHIQTRTEETCRTPDVQGEKSLTVCLHYGMHRPVVQLCVLQEGERTNESSGREQGQVEPKHSAHLIRGTIVRRVPDWPFCH